MQFCQQCGLCQQEWKSIREKPNTLGRLLVFKYRKKMAEADPGHQTQIARRFSSGLSALNQLTTQERTLLEVPIFSHEFFAREEFFHAIKQDLIYRLTANTLKDIQFEQLILGFSEVFSNDEIFQLRSLLNDYLEGKVTERKALSVLTQEGAEPQGIRNVTLFHRRSLDLRAENNAPPFSCPQLDEWRMHFATTFREDHPNKNVRWLNQGTITVTFPFNSEEKEITGLEDQIAILFQISCKPGIKKGELIQALGVIDESRFDRLLESVQKPYALINNENGTYSINLDFNDPNDTIDLKKR